MCLENDPEEVKKLLNKNRIDCYKMVDYYNKELCSIYRVYKYKPDWNYSDSTADNPSFYYESIYKGMYVFLHKPQLDNNRNFYYFNDQHVLVPCGNQFDFSYQFTIGYRLIRCKAFISDLIGANKREAVFKKIYIPKVNYRGTISKIVA